MNHLAELEPMGELVAYRPPHLYPVAAEQACVGLVLQRGAKAMATIRELVRVDDFEDPQSRAAARALFALDDDGEIPAAGRMGLVALVAALRANKDDGLFPGGKQQIDHVFLRDAPAFGDQAGPEIAARLVGNAARLRLGLEAAEAASRSLRGRHDLARSQVSSEFLQGVAKEFSAFADRTVSDEVAVHISVVADEHDQIMQDRLEGKASVVEFGIRAVDELLDGSDADAGDLVVLAARPSMGKTATMQAIIRGQNIRPRSPESVTGLRPRPWQETWVELEQKTPALIASAEMSETQLLDRRIADLVSINSRRIQRPIRKDYRNEDMRRWQEVAPLVAEAKRFARTWPVSYVPKPRVLEEIERTAKGWRRKHPVIGVDARGRERQGPAVLLVDHLTELSMIGGNPNKGRLDLYYGEIGARLKALAKELRIVVVLLMQLNRGLERRDDKRPLLSDLREAGKIEELADAALFCYRAPYYGDGDSSEANLWQRYWALRREDDQSAQLLFDRATEMEIIARKVRQGSIGIAKARFVRNFTRVVDRGSGSGSWG